MDSACENARPAGVDARRRAPASAVLLRMRRYSTAAAHQAMANRIHTRELDRQPAADRNFAGDRSDRRFLRVIREVVRQQNARQLWNAHWYVWVAEKRGD